jgi:hypothetical protein
VSLSLSNFGYWGGANDGVYHLPIKFSNFILIDGNKRAQSSTVYFTPPILVSLILKNLTYFYFLLFVCVLFYLLIATCIDILIVYKVELARTINKNTFKAKLK